MSAHPPQAASSNFGNWRGRLTQMAQVLTTAYQGSWMGVNVMVMRTLRLAIPAGYTALLVPLSDIVGLIPLFFNNLGARSGAFFVMLQPLGIAAAAVAALSLLVYLVRMGVSCLGGVPYIVGSVTGSGADLAAPLSRSPAQKV